MYWDSLFQLTHHFLYLCELLFIIFLQLFKMILILLLELLKLTLTMSLDLVHLEIVFLFDLLKVGHILVLDLVEIIRDYLGDHSFQILFWVLRRQLEVLLLESIKSQSVLLLGQYLYEFFQLVQLLSLGHELCLDAQKYFRQLLSLLVNLRNFSFRSKRFNNLHLYQILE